MGPYGLRILKAGGMYLELGMGSGSLTTFLETASTLGRVTGFWALAVFILASLDPPGI